MALVTRRQAIAAGMGAALSSRLTRRAFGDEPAPKRGGTFIMAGEGDPIMLTSFNSGDTPTNMVSNNIFSPLVSLSPSLEPVPELAESWTISPDGRVYTFKLVSNALWHDGQKLTADDVAFTFNEIIAKANPASAAWWPNVESATAIDATTFEFRLHDPYAPFLANLGFPLSSGALIMPKHIYAGTDPRTNPANQRPIGTGPFRFKEWQKGNYVEMVRNDHFWKPQKPWLDRLILQITPDPAARFLAFQRGEIDFIHWYILPYDKLAGMRKDPHVRLMEKGNAPGTLGYVLMNFRNQYLGNRAVRQAIGLAVNRQTIADNALFGAAPVARSHLSSGLTRYFTPDYDLKFDPAAAERLLDEAGFRRDSNGQRFALRLAWGAGRDYEGRAAEIIRDNLKQVGITVNVQMNDRTTLTNRVFMQWDFDMSMQLFTTGPDPTVGVQPRYHTSQIRKAYYVNAMGYSNKELDGLFDTEMKQVDIPRRAEMWRRIQQILMTDLPALPLYDIPPIHAVSSRIMNAVTGPQGYVQSREDAYVVE
jgi:peptide/nickel transport system substrate-binding protein